MRAGEAEFGSHDGPPGCVATGATLEEVEKFLREAIEVHIAGLREDGLPVPAPSSVVEYLEVPV
jgi:predicted RNase H-like HicB family nuclease